VSDVPPVSRGLVKHMQDLQQELAVTQWEGQPRSQPADPAPTRRDLEELSAAIDRVSANRRTLHGGIQGLRATFSKVADSWQSPAGTSFVSATGQFNAVAGNTLSVLDDAIGRMRATYDNHVSAEAANISNLE
jgi:uncharacterized protein YukE